jgi:superfamily I DNA/RNA helicase
MIPRSSDIFHDRYQRLLIDEFQDTDPLQVAIACGWAGVRPISPVIL